MKALLAAVILVAGCAAGVVPSGAPVPIATYNGDGLSCFTDAEPHKIVADPETGTAMLINGERWPLAWPRGYVGRQMGSEVAVYTNTGQLAAVTGRSYLLAGFGNAESDPMLRPFQVGCADRLGPG